MTEGSQGLYDARVGVVTGDARGGRIGGCSWYRAILPLQASGKKRGEDWVAGIDGLTSPVGVAVRDAETGTVMKPDVLVLVRCGTADQIEWVRCALRAGQRIVVDIDEALWLVPPTNEAHGASRMDPTADDSAYWLLQLVTLCDRVTTTTEKLADEIDRWYRKNTRGRTPPIRVVPNMVDVVQWQKAGEPPERVFAWTGSTRHRDYELRAIEALGDVVRAVGWEPLHIGPGELSGWRNVPGRPVEEWHTTARLYRVALAATVASTFSDCKSHIKALEAAAAGRVPVVTKTKPYRDWWDVVPTIDDLGPHAVSVLVALLGDEAALKDAAERAKRKAEQYDIRRRWPEFLRAWMD